MLGGVGDAEPERRKAAAATDDIEACQHLGHQDRVAARYHRDGRAEFQVLAAAGDVGHRHDRIELHRIDALGEPQAVEAETVEVIDDGTESGEFSPGLRVETRDGAEGVTDAHLHAQTMTHPAAADRIPRVHATDSLRRVSDAVFVPQGDLLIPQPSRSARGSRECSTAARSPVSSPEQSSGFHPLSR